MKHLFNGMQESEKYPYVEKFASSPNMEDEDIEEVLKKQPYSPYYMMYLSKRNIFR